MKIDLASIRIIDNDIDFNLSQMRKYMIQAKNQKADIICFGETFLQGFNALSWVYEKDKNIAISTSSSIFNIIKQMTIDIGIDILFGYNELVDEFIYSSCALISNGQLLYNYRRISKGWKYFYKTDCHYKEGNEVKIFKYQNKKCLIALCGDLYEYPDRFMLNEDILFWPVYVSYSKDEWENNQKDAYLKQASLCANHVLYFNSICDNDAYGGCAYFTNNKIGKELSLENEDLLFIDIN